jgi:2-dehydropantoate 2-reductase
MLSKHITVIGLGGVGGYFGFKIARLIENNPNYHITFIARNETYQVVKNVGLTLLSPEYDMATTKPDKILASAAQLEQSDLILLCVKEYDLENVCKAISSKITEHTIIIPLMNGADIYQRVRKVIHAGTLLPACVYVASHIKEKGVVEHKGNVGKIILGKDPENKDWNTKWVIELLQESGADVTFKDDCFADIWTKFAFISSFGLVTARYNKSIGQVCEEGLLRERAVKIIEEIQRIALKCNIDLPTDIVDKTLEKAHTFPYGTPTSLQLDINGNKAENELELFAGAIVNYGKATGIKTEETSKIYNEITEILKQR